MNSGAEWMGVNSYQIVQISNCTDTNIKSYLSELYLYITNLFITASVKINCLEINDFKAEAGIRQRCILFLILFNIYTDD